jgi:hypothetical protein
MTILEHAPQTEGSNPFISRFSNEATYYLEDTGHTIFPIRSLSVEEMIIQGLPIGRVHHWREFRSFKPPATEAAINFRHPILDFTNEQPLKRQIPAIRYYNESLKRIVKGVQAIIPDVSTACQLDLRYQEMTGKNLLDGFMIRTSTEVDDTHVVVVGRYNPKWKLCVWALGKGSLARVSVIPVITPLTSK